MFAFPVTVPVQHAEGTYSVDVTVNIDDVLKVLPLHGIDTVDVESVNFYSCVPATEIVMTDGRKLPVLETAATINRYLDAYRVIENFYTKPADPTGIRNRHMVCEKPDGPRVRPLDGTTEGVVVPLFGNRKCATSEASTPD